VTTVICGVAGTYAYNGDGLRTTRTLRIPFVSYVWDQNAGLSVILQDGDGNRYVYGARGRRDGGVARGRRPRAAAAVAGGSAEAA